MQKVSDNLNIGLIQLSSDFRILSTNPNARKILGLIISESSQIVFAYFKQSIKPKNALLPKQCCSSGAYMPVAMAIDMLNKFLLVHPIRVNMHKSYGETLFSIPN